MCTYVYLAWSDLKQQYKHEADIQATISPALQFFTPAAL